MTSQDDGRNSFVRGMTIGAIIGAIVAGSSLWSRRRRARRVPFEGESAPERLGSGFETSELPPAPVGEPAGDQAAGDQASD
jgi:hypothetical protein